VTTSDFIDKTAILPSVVVSRVTEDSNLTPERLRWFHDHVAKRLCLMYPRYKAQFKRESSIDFVYMWVRHWLAAYLLDPEQYEAKHD